jgi:protein TonB
MNQVLVGYAALTGSLLVHVWAIVGSPAPVELRRASRPPSLVQLFDAPRQPEPEPEPPPPPEPPKPPEKETPVLPPKAPEPDPTPVEEARAETAEPSPPELTGTTLLGAQGEGFTAPQGSGGAREGAILAGVSRPIAPKPTRHDTARVAAKPPSTPVLSLKELSRKPVPPALGSALERNYPSDARSLGKSGNAKVRARIEPSGEVRIATIAFETSSGFGDACKKTLLGSRWSAPLDRSGRPVATWVTYQCKFRVD